MLDWIDALFDWIFDHIVVSIVALLAAFAIFVAGIIYVTGGASCPKGQHEVFQYFVPLIISTKTGTTISEIPVYSCER